MRIRRRSYPYPVLSPFSDDVQSRFQADVHPRPGAQTYIFDAAFRTNNAELLKMVSEKRAHYAVHLECAKTRYRRIFIDSEQTFSFTVDSGHIDGTVDICSLLLAAVPVEAYRSESFHPDYGSRGFALRAGDTLAVGSDCIFLAEKKDDPLRSVRSIFSITSADGSDAAPMDVDLESPRILIKLSEANYRLYSELQADAAARSVLNSAVIGPALASVLEKMRLGEVDIEASGDRLWYSVLARRLKDFNIDAADPHSFVDSSLTIANRLIGQPLNACLLRLRGLLDQGEE